ncbi:hypothetical protein HN51_004757, partial [Arachis hypogaea]
MLVSSGNSQRHRQISCPPRMAYRTLPSMAASSSSSSSKKHDVFISFRGEDTRNNFTSHLCAALNQSKIQVFIDNRISKGDENSSSIFKAIRDSNVSVVVLSKDYASSTWCMRELTKILEQKRHGKGHIVVPVFYKIDPSHVRKQIGTYKKAFEKHERDVKHNILLKWKAALTEVANLVGWDSQNYRIESELVEEVVKDVMQKLNCIYPPEVKDLVGIDQNLAPIKSLLRIRSREVRIIGIWGMGGIGKTTIAKALFSKLSSQYEGSCFLENVREESEQHLLNKLLSEALEDANHYFGTPIARSTFVMRRLSRKKVLIVLDDVDNLKKLEDLAAKHNFLGPGSRVIVTTRDKHVLSKGVDEIYEVKGLPLHHAIQLFSLNAFDKSYPESGFVMLSKMVVDYANGNPLALKVLGSFLHSRNLQQWNSALRKLTKFPNTEIQNVLRWSYDGLDDDEQKNMFLDIACFFQGEKKETVTRLLDICGFYADIGIRILQDKALITFSDANELHMHDLIQEMGLEIVRQESTKDPGRRSRLWDPEEIYDLLKNDRINLRACSNLTNLPDLSLAPNLERVDLSLCTSLLCVPTSIKYTNKLLLFNLESCKNLKSLPRNIHLFSLQMFILKGCSSLDEFSLTSENMTRLDLRGTDIEHFPESLWQLLNQLVYLNLESCAKLKSLTSNIHLVSLQRLNLRDCSSLEVFSVTSENMEYLNLGGTSIKGLPTSIWRNNKLFTLVLHSCKRLVNFPDKPKLGELSLTFNEKNSFEGPTVDEPWNLSSLSDLSLKGSGIVNLPASIKDLPRLKKLTLMDCKKLRSLPSLPSSLEDLSLDERNIDFLP